MLISNQHACGQQQTQAQELELMSLAALSSANIPAYLYRLAKTMSYDHLYRPETWPETAEGTVNAGPTMDAVVATVSWKVDDSLATHVLYLQFVPWLSHMHWSKSKLADI